MTETNLKHDPERLEKLKMKVVSLKERSSKLWGSWKQDYVNRIEILNKAIVEEELLKEREIKENAKP